MSHDWMPTFPGAGRSMPCRMCGRTERAHQRPVHPGDRLTHNDILDCGGRQAEPITFG